MQFKLLFESFNSKKETIEFLVTKIDNATIKKTIILIINILLKILKFIFLYIIIYI